MRPRHALLVVLALAALLTAAPAGAEESIDQQTMEIARLLRCPVCQNLSVADSSSQLAGQMRDIIRRKVEAGESRDQILAYFVDRYGEEVLISPPTTGFSGLAWWGAAAIPVAGIAVAAVYLRRRLALGGDDRSGTPDEEEAW